MTRLAQRGIRLAAKGVARGASHPRLLDLMERPSRLDRMMLPLVTDEDDARNACVASLMQKTIDLPGPEQARLVNNPKLLTVCLLERVFDEARNGAGADRRSLCRAGPAPDGGNPTVPRHRHFGPLH